MSEPSESEEQAETLQDAPSVFPSGHIDDTGDGLVTTLFAVYFASVFAAVFAIYASGVDVFSLTYWGQEGERSAIVRNLSIVAVGIIGLPFGIWRAITAHRQTATANSQARTANEQSKTANRQADVAEKGLIIDRFQKGAQMLESKELSVRLAGIYALRELVVSDPKDTYTIVLDLLLDFARERSKMRYDADIGETLPCSADIQKALETASFLRTSFPRRELLGEFGPRDPDLRGADLSSAELVLIDLYNTRLSNADLSHADLSHSNLSGSDFTRASLTNTDLTDTKLDCTSFTYANMTKANLIYANLDDADLRHANLTGAILVNASLNETDLTGANLTGAKLERVSLNNADLNAIWAFVDNPPKDMPTEVASAIALRGKSETWPEFVERIMRERPELGWIREFDHMRLL